MYELLSGSFVVCVDGLVEGDGVSLLIGNMWSLLCLYLQPWASMKYDLGVWAGPMMVPSKYDV